MPTHDFPMHGVAVPATGPTEIRAEQQGSGDFVLHVAGHDYLVAREDGLALGKVLRDDDEPTGIDADADDAR